MATIDNLTLEITANTSKAVRDIQKLAEALSALRDATKGMSASNINKVADAMSNFKYSCAGISLSTIRRVTQLADAVERVASINAGNISKVADAMRKFNSAMGKGKGAGTTATKATESVFNAPAMTSMGGALEKIFNAPSAEGLARVFGGDFTQGAILLEDKLKDVSGATQECYGSFRELNTEVTKGGLAFEKTADSASKTSSSVGGFWTKFQTIFGMTKSNPISLLASSENADGMAKLAEKSGIAVGVLTKLSKVLGWVGLALSAISIGVKVFKKAFDLILSPIKKAVKAIQSFGRALARIAFYRFIRSILKGITQGVQEGVQNLALYSKAMEELDTHSANHVMSRYASEFLYFKNAIATAVMPVLRAMIPLIEQVINKVIDFINVLAQIGSAFFGGTFTKAKYFWVDYADSLDKANGRAKALHHQLAGFDELNNLTAPSGGSGSPELLDPSKMFEEANISGKILEKVEKIKEVIEKIKKFGKDIWDIVKPIKDKVVDIFNWFKKLWDRIYPNLQKVWELVEKIWDKVAKPLTEGFIKGFLDGLFGDTDSEGADDMIEKIGKISDAIGTASEKISGWLDKLDTEKMKDFGEAVGKLLGNIAFYSAYLPIPFALFGQPKFHEDIDKLTKKIEKFNEKLDKLKESITSFISSIIQLIIDWNIVCWDLGSAIGKAIGEFLRTGDIETAWNRLTEKLEQIFETAKEVIGGDLDTIKQKLLDLVRDIPIIGVIVDFFSDNPSSKNYNPARASLGKGYNPSRATLSGYASGGFPMQGDLFIANERGAEMVGSIGNQTAVANNDQITQAIATATYNAMSKALSENNGNVTVVVEGDGDQMYKIWQKKNREYERRTGLAY